MDVKLKGAFEKFLKERTGISDLIGKGSAVTETHLNTILKISNDFVEELIAFEPKTARDRAHKYRLGEIVEEMLEGMLGIIERLESQPERLKEQKQKEMKPLKKGK